MLIDLRLLSCEGITSASMAAIAYSRLLEVVILFLWYNFVNFLLQELIGLLCHLWQALQLDNCSLLTSVSLDLPHLKNISLVHLRK